MQDIKTSDIIDRAQAVIAREAEAVAAPLKVEAETTRAAYLAAMDVADQKRTLAEQAKAALYRLVAARQVADIMESPNPPKPANQIDEIVFAKLGRRTVKTLLGRLVSD